MNFSQIQCFITVAKLRSFTEASEALFMTQSAISKQIKRLEFELKTVLFHRYPRSIDLTDAGKAFLVRAEHLMSQYLNTLSDMEEYALKQKEGLNICAEPGSFPYGIPRLIGEYMNIHPEMDITFRERPAESILSRLENGSADIIFTWIEEMSNNQFVVVPIIEDPAVLITPPDHALVKKDWVEMADFAGEYIAMLARDINKPYYRMLEHAGLQKNIKYDLARTESMFYLASEGSAVAMVLGERARAWKNTPIGIVKIKGDPIIYRYSAVYQNGKKAKKARDLIDYLAVNLRRKNFASCKAVVPNP